MRTDPRHASGRAQPARLIRWLGWCSLAGLLATWFALDVLGDRVWWTVPLLFGPRWLLAAAWLGFVPWLVVDIHRAAAPALLGLAIAALAIVGWHIPLRRAGAGTGIAFRVLELNAGGSGAPRTTGRILAELAAQRPDLVVVAECGPALAQALGGIGGYHARAGEDLCLLTRGDIVEWDPRDQMDAWRHRGSGAIIRAVIGTPAGLIRVGLVHLATPRNALDTYFSASQLPSRGPETRANMAQRDDESRQARAWILAGPMRPTLILGDFNLPAESAIYRRSWGSFRNAFGRAGWGTGYTKHTRFWGVRIDHVLATSDVGTRDSFIGHDVGSDHLPLIADLVLPAPRPLDPGR